MKRRTVIETLLPVGLAVLIALGLSGVFTMPQPAPATTGTIIPCKAGIDCRNGAPWVLP